MTGHRLGIALVQAQQVAADGRFQIGGLHVIGERGLVGTTRAPFTRTTTAGPGAFTTPATITVERTRATLGPIRTLPVAREPLRPLAAFLGPFRTIPIAARVLGLLRTLEVLTLRPIAALAPVITEPIAAEALPLLALPPLGAVTTVRTLGPVATIAAEPLAAVPTTVPAESLSTTTVFAVTPTAIEAALSTLTVETALATLTLEATFTPPPRG
nr:hypothetical protein [Nocardia inohanensis]